MDESHITDIYRLDDDCKCIIHWTFYLFQRHLSSWSLYGRLCRSGNNHGVHTWQYSDSREDILDRMGGNNKYSVLKCVLLSISYPVNW